MISPEAAHILIVEDDQGIRDNLTLYLSGKGFLCSAVPDAESAERVMSVILFDLLVVDILMPGMTGTTFVQRLRTRSRVPVIMLTALSQLKNKLEGFGSGCDDYLPKPFEPEELVARIHAQLLRAAESKNSAQAQREISFGACRFDRLREELWKDEVPIQLTQREADLLSRLAARPNCPVERGELIVKADGSDLSDQNRAVDVRVSPPSPEIRNEPEASSASCYGQRDWIQTGGRMNGL